MVKKIVLMTIVLSVISGAMFARERERDSNVSKPLNTISMHVNLIGLAANYERHFTPRLSLLGDLSFNMLIPTYAIAAKGRIYPSANIFYMEMGVGFAQTVGTIGGIAKLTGYLLTFGFGGLDDDILLTGVVFTPALGWKIPLGRRSGLSLPISLGVDFYYGSREWDVPFDFTPNLRIGMGYSF